MSARVMAGPELCDAWPAISMRYIIRTLTAQGATQSRSTIEATELVRQVFEARQAEYASSGAAAERHDDFIQWIMDSYRADGKNFKAEEIVHNVFIVMFESMHGTSFIALQ
ncbi:hypothetical protein UCDDA912_g00926 [Diaporthe ampelina]|uniref:Cytochrome p450 n=1 Tax=Diaporthe ampelina TaxID=1214573 RepID=A0A0G2FYS7_9PEZI|nr:hypothetical protein UCDDA912_g00926 [Diaporthe ampelina]